jgi:hypothetical protein
MAFVPTVATTVDLRSFTFWRAASRVIRAFESYHENRPAIDPPTCLQSPAKDQLDRTFGTMLSLIFAVALSWSERVWESVTSVCLVMVAFSSDTVRFAIIEPFPQKAESSQNDFVKSFAVDKLSERKALRRCGQFFWVQSSKVSDSGVFQWASYLLSE